MGSLVLQQLKDWDTQCFGCLSWALKLGDSYYMWMFWMSEYNRCFKMPNTLTVLDDCINSLFLDVRVHLFFSKKTEYTHCFRWVLSLFWIFGALTVLDVWVRTIADGGWAYVGRPLGPGRITRLVGVPVLLTVITEVGVAARAPTVNLGTPRTACGYHCIAIINNKHVFSCQKYSKHHKNQYAQCSKS